MKTREHYKIWIRRHHKVCIDKLHLNRKDIFLDIGCGESGSIENYVVDLADLVIALDISLDALLRAQSKVVGEVEFVRASASYLPLKSGSIDKIAMLEVLEHTLPKNELKTLVEIQRVIKRGGKFVVSVPSRNPLHLLLDPAFLLGLHRHYNEKELIEKVGKLGFSTVEVSRYGGIKRAVLMLIWYFFSPFFKRRRLGHDEIPLLLKNLMDKDYLAPRKNGYMLVLLGKAV